MAKKDKIYTIIDIETTGGMSHRDRITEVAMVRIQNGEIIDRFESLINPERSIPTEITRITGITNDMVANAPKFYEVAKTIVEFTEDAIFVAHNVRFDYNFIREEFKSLGYTYSKKLLCTVQLSRKAFPGLRSYSLGNLIRHFGIEVVNRHRAMDDVLATADIFLRIVDQAKYSEKAQAWLAGGIKELNLPNNLSREFLEDLPEVPGVYYFYNQHRTIIYVGKSINIKQRIFQHFSSVDTKSEKMSQKTHDISYEVTGHELIALLLESEEIKKHKPEINKTQRRAEYPFYVYSYEDEFGYINFNFDRIGKSKEENRDILVYTATKNGARSFIFQAMQLYGLCGGKTGFHACGTDCFHYQSGECPGAGIGFESAEAYNERAAEARENMFRSFKEDFFLTTPGRQVGEHALVLIVQGHYRGFGYIASEVLDEDQEKWWDAIRRVEPNPEFNRIVSTYLKSQEPGVKKIFVRSPQNL